MNIINNDSSKESNPGRSEIENPRAFLYQIARNLVTDHYRQGNRALIIPLEDVQIEDPNPGPEKEVFLDSSLKYLGLALNKIPEQYQDVIIWYYLDDIPIREIAKIMDKSQGAVRVMIHRALKALREEIGESG